jgi:hypothetical protein
MPKLSGQQHSFAVTPSINAPRSVFNRRSTYKTTFDIGWLIPFFWDEVYPGDTFNAKSTVFLRLATPLNPIMDVMYADVHWFFAQNRILWDNWRKFCGEQVDPGDSIDYTIPVLSDGSSARFSNADSGLSTVAMRVDALMNYMGIPDGIGPSSVDDINALPFRAYSRIYNEWFRDSNLINSVDAGLLTDDGPDNVGGSDLHHLQRRGKRHDYFTSALPWPQKPDATWGSGGVTLPLGSTADVIRDGSKYIRVTNGTDTKILTMNSGSSDLELDAASGSTGAVYPADDATGFGLVTDLTNATAATINDLREAFQIQKLLERDAMAGTRYPEVILNHFGVHFPETAYRPVYLGGGSFPINITPIAQTANTTSGTSSIGVGDLAAMGTGYGDNLGFNYTFNEHGIVMGIISVRNDLHYQQGLRREFSRSTRYDYYWPSLAHLGMQPIYNKEIYCDGSANDDLVFGYQNRYDELRYRQSQITGLFQSGATSSLDPWHLADEYASLPTLGQTFIEVNTDLDRCIQVTSEPHFIMDSVTELLCARPMPVNAVPGLIDHF